jgi:hypothetical protein
MRRRILIGALAAAGALFAQSTAPVRGEISGVVLEPGVAGAPVAEAEVTLDYYGPTQPRIMPSPPQKSSSTTASATGAFVFHVAEPGYYGVRCKKTGFNEAGANSASPTRLNFTITERAPSKEVKLYLTRPVTVTGTAIDAETGKPLADQTIGGGAVMLFAGRRMTPTRPAKTDAEGRFSIAGNPGDWLVQVLPQRVTKDRVLKSFTDDDVQKVDTDVERTYWPGGFGEEAAMPMPVSSGATVDIGRVRVKRISYYRVHLKVPKSGCEPNDTLTVYETVRGPQFETRTNGIGSDVPCGTDLLVTGFAPGNYWLALATKTAPHATVTVPVTITSKNVEAVAALSRGVAVDVRFQVEDGATAPDWQSINMMLDPVWSVRMADSILTAKPDGKGNVHFEHVGETEHRVAINGVPATYYLKEIRYNGIAVPDRIVPLDRPAMGHSLTIVLDDKPASITGTAAGAATVLVFRWPLPANQVLLATGRGAADDQGRFQVGGLAPGEYRAVALLATEDEYSRQPGSLERALEAAKKIEVGPRESKTVELTAISLR